MSSALYSPGLPSTKGLYVRLHEIAAGCQALLGNAWARLWLALARCSSEDGLGCLLMHG